MKKHPWRMAGLILSLLLCLMMLYCLSSRANAVAAVTIFPSWLWLFAGLLFLAFSFHRHATRGFRYLALITGVLWLIYLVTFVEEPRSMIRAVLRHPSQTTGQMLRVVTLNCAGGSSAAAAEVARFHPDIILWQEIPSPPEIRRLTKKILGPRAEVVMGLDTAIAARGRVEAQMLPREMQRFCAQARVHFSDGREMAVASLHLMTPPLRVDLWSPDCWKSQSQQRQIQREQLQSIGTRLAKISTTMPVIVGGDFNMPQGDAVLRLLQPRLQDSFRLGGLGWGDTITNEFPLLRIDQIWVSSAFTVRGVRAYHTRYSDHRMVVCDLILRQ